ncbi:unnamed protein product, partial [marine sediment metagenome]
MAKCVFCKRLYGLETNSNCEHYDPIEDVHIGPDGTTSRS